MIKRMTVIMIMEKSLRRAGIVVDWRTVIVKEEKDFDFATN